MTLTNAELIEKCVKAFRGAFHSASPHADFGYAEVRAVIAVLAEPGNLPESMRNAAAVADDETGWREPISAAIGSILK